MDPELDIFGEPVRVTDERLLGRVVVFALTTGLVEGITEMVGERWSLKAAAVLALIPACLMRDGAHNRPASQ